MRVQILAKYCAIGACAVSTVLSASIIVNDPQYRTSFHHDTTGRIEPPYDEDDNYVTAGGLNGSVFVNSNNLRWISPSLSRPQGVVVYPVAFECFHSMG